MTCKKAVFQKCSVKKVFLEISQNSQENTSARVSFLIKFATGGCFWWYNKAYGLNTSYYVSLIFWSGKAFFELLRKLLGLALAILSKQSRGKHRWYILICIAWWQRRQILKFCDFAYNQGGLYKQTQLNLCNIFSIFIFNEF